MADALRIAVVGAESTGKTTLAAALAEALRGDGQRRVAWVPELLRDWCTRNGRTPLAHEQGPILRAQHERIEAAAATHDVVVCDTTALMTAVYSALLFGDRSLDARAIELHRRMSLSLLMALDLPWVADGLQRDGPQVQQPVDQAIRAHLLAHRLPFVVVSGQGPARLAMALAAVQPLLAHRGWAHAAPAVATARAAGGPAGAGACGDPTASAGMFSGLRPARTAHARSRRWACGCCDPEAEAALSRARREA